MTAWMLYAVLVGGLAAGAARALEALLWPHRRPTRWAWAGGLAFSALWPVPALLRVRWGGGGGILQAGPSLRVSVLEPLSAVADAGSRIAFLDRPLAVLWAGASGLLLVAAVVSWLRLRRARARWRREQVDGVSILVSRATGPALVGVLRPSVVLPAWCRNLEARHRRLILAHEEEHRRAGDLPLLCGGWAAVVAFPWNPALWFQLRRLRLAVEADCDRRVLRRFPGATREYFDLLITVAERLRFPVLQAGALLTEPLDTLERRIRMSTLPEPRAGLRRAALLGSLSALLLAVACLAPGPDDADSDPLATDAAQETGVAARSEEAGEAREERAAPATEDSGGPEFTPYTEKPEILNRAQVAEALVREYPPLLRDAGIGGTTLVWFFIDETGAVARTRLGQSSGHRELDAAALRVAQSVRFRPARNRGEPVSVWVALPITFTPR